MVELGFFERAQTIVGAAIDIQHQGVALEQSDRGQEARALQAILIETVGLDVRCRYQRHAMPE